jgi:hypothetical protein
MDNSILDRSMIIYQAQNAAHTYGKLSECCPHPTGSDAAAIFEAAWQEERDWLTRAKQATPQAHT